MPRKIRDLLVCAGFLAAAILISSIILHINDNEGNIAIIFTLSTFLVSKYTLGYRWGLISAVVGVICINFIFTYPYFDLNFTISGYPITFLSMLLVSSITSAMTTRIYRQNQLAMEREALLMEAEKEKMRSNLLRAVSHDLRTPLTSMIGASSTYLEAKEYLDEEEKDRLIQGIYEDGNWLLNMVENLLSVTRIHQETAKVKKTEEALEEVVSEALIRFQKRYPDANIQLNIPDEFLLVPMDATLIEQVIINLLENAVVHGQSADQIDFSITACSDSICFAIRDYGPGIPPEQLHSIFDGSPVSHEDKNDRRKGMGIGLSICKTIIKAHKGEIYAKNLGDGAQFSFRLPLKEEKTP